MNFIPPKKRFYNQPFLRQTALLLAFVVFFELLTSGLLLTQTKEYGAEAKVIVIQKQLETHDVFSTVKAGEQIAAYLANAVRSTAFLNVLIGRDDFSRLSLSADAVEQIQEWRGLIEAKVEPGTANIVLASFDANRGRALDAVRLATAGLVEFNSLFHGGGDQVVVKLLDPQEASF